MNYSQAIKALYDADHCFLRREAGEEISHALGIKPPDAQCQTVDPTEFKGLTVKGKKKGDKVFGYDARYLADCLASRVAEKLNIQYDNPCFGRGSGLRFAIKFIEDNLPKVSK